MAMRVSAPAKIVRLVNELIIWYETEDSSNPLGYPAHTCENRIGMASGGKPGAAVPHHMMPRALVPVSRAINTMPCPLRTALLHRHLDGYNEYRNETGLGKAIFYKRCDQAYWFIAGCLSSV